MSVHQNKSNGTWLVKYQNTTKRGFKLKREAQEYEARLKLEKKEPNCFKKFHDVAQDYIICKEKEVEYGTYSKIKQVITNIIIPNTKNKLIFKIDEIDCREFKYFVQELSYSTRYKNFLLSQYKAIFKHSKLYFKNDNDPTYILETFKATMQERKLRKDNEMNIWSEDELKAFLEVIDKPIYKELFITLYFTGIRLGEAQALSWEDFDGKQLNIDKSYTKKVKQGAYKIKGPKTVTSIRKVSLGFPLAKLLNDFKESEKKLYGFKESWYIFGRTKPLSRTNIDNVKRKALEVTNVKPIRIHDFRHSHASNLLASGINIVAISKRLGHGDINITLKIYSHLLQKNDDELLQELEKASQFLLNH